MIIPVKGMGVYTTVAAALLLRAGILVVITLSILKQRSGFSKHTLGKPPH